jgi:hypothetical protein
MMRNRKVWGVLGLLLALVLAVGVGYGQPPEPPVPKPPVLRWVLTVNHPCTRAAGNQLELFVLDNDVHPTRSITYQNDPASVGFLPPDNPANCPGVAYFFRGWPPDYYGGTIQLYINSTLPGASYTPKLCFREFPPPPASTPDPQLFITATASFPLPLWSASPTISTNPGPSATCQCVTGPALNNVPAGTQWVKWKFGIKDNSVEFCRVEVWPR